MLKLLKTYILPIALLIGALAYPLFSKGTFLMPYLIFAVLVLGFCKVSLKELRITWSHLIILSIEILGSIAIYYAVAPFSVIVAQGLMICFICPTAASSTVLTQKLDGNSNSITSFLLLGNVSIALFVPLFFPVITESSTISFWAAFSQILAKIFPLLIAPFLIAQFLRYVLKPVHRFLLNWSHIAFYIWAISLTIVSGVTTKSIIQADTNGWPEVCMIVGSGILCLLQFWMGKKIGSNYNDTIASGQGFGQKNTILAIWLVNAYLNPLAGLAPGLYVVWQNIFNAWQITRKEKSSHKTPINTRELVLKNK